MDSFKELSAELDAQLDEIFAHRRVPGAGVVVLRGADSFIKTHGVRAFGGGCGPIRQSTRA